MRFVKMHGIGNDYVYVDAYSTAGEVAIAERADLPEIARRVSDRLRGVGSDGLILVCMPNAGVDAHVRMRMLNSDGSESEMCGNGVRCVAKFAHDRLGMRFMPLRVETVRGVLSISYEAPASSGGRLTSATVDMGEPILELARVPVDEGRLGSVVAGGAGGRVGAGGAHRVARVGEVDGAGIGRWVGSFVSMGNPHAVFFDGVNEALRGEGLARLEIERVGPRIEVHPAFPRRVNAHFVQVHSADEATMRTWERGAGATQACGTGACAVLVAGVLTGRLARKATLHLPGGDLVIEWDQKTNHVFMTGPAEDICEGEWKLPTVVENVVWTHQPEIVTERLALRPLRFEDAERVAKLANTEEVARWTLLLPHPYRVQDAWSWMATHQRAMERGEGQHYAITLREGVEGAQRDEVIGVIGLRADLKHSRAELGYWVGVPFWGKGYASEAAAAMVRHGLDTLGLRRVYAYHFAGNEASGRVLAKAGMKPEGVQVGHITKNGVVMDDVLYGVTRE